MANLKAEQPTSETAHIGSSGRLSCPFQRPRVSLSHPAREQELIGALRALFSAQSAPKSRPWWRFWDGRS